MKEHAQEYKSGTHPANSEHYQLTLLADYHSKNKQDMIKRFLLLGLAFMLVSLSCKKIEERPWGQETKTLLPGEWHEVSSEIMWYNGFWSVVHQESRPLGTVSFDAGSVTTYYPETGGTRSQYNLSADPYGEYMNVTNGNNSFVFKIEEITQNTLVLSLETRNEPYIADGIKYRAARCIKTVKLTR